MDTLFANLQENTISTDISHMLALWTNDDERIMIFGAHDDDPLIGAGYIMAEAQKKDIEVFVTIFCQGDCGYSVPEQRDMIVGIRKEENVNALAQLGIDRSHIIRFELPDFSLMHHKGYHTRDGGMGLFPHLVDLIREYRITRAFIPNDFREHCDHTAAFEMCAFDLIQAGDPILSDRAEPYKVRSIHQYSVWADFSPLNTILASEPKKDIRANFAILADPGYEYRVREALKYYKSQGKIIKELVNARSSRIVQGRCAELYLLYDPRPSLKYEKYHDCLTELLNGHEPQNG